MNENRVVIFDTTLRDGEQSPGATMNIKEKLEVAHQLARLGVDVIEAGFPISSDGDFESVNLIAREAKGPTICGLARANKPDIVRAGESIGPADKGRIHTFIATSDIHMKKKLRMEPPAVIEAAYESVKLARSFTDDVEFSCEDASRSDWDFMCRVLEAAIEAGATTLNIPDTVGYAVPEQYRKLIAYLRENTKGIENCILSVHCHDDLGMAVANSLAGVQGGARQVECTINGIGERAGNASLEEIVMALRTRSDFFGLDTGIKATEIYRTSRMVSAITGMAVQANKAIVGANAFAHEAGIHQDGVIKDKQTYEIMKPDDVGWMGENMVMGKHSGRAAFRQKLFMLGFTNLNPEELNRAFERFKALCDAKKEVYDEDIYAIVEDEFSKSISDYKLDFLEVTSSTDGRPRADMKVSRGGELFEEAVDEGDGPIDAVFKGLESIVGLDIKLLDFGLTSVTAGKDAQGRVKVRLQIGGREIRGHGVATDIVIGAAEAYLNAVNRYLMTKDSAMFSGAEAMTP